MLRAALLAIALASLAGCSRDASRLSADRAPPIDGLEVQSGQPFRLAAHRGKVVLLSFGYTACLELCPDTFATAKNVLASLGEGAKDVTFAYVTVDPERDDPPRFGKFMATVDPRFEGVYLAPPALAPVLEGYHVTVRKRLPDPERYAKRNVDPSAFYAMDHTAGFWLVDRRGRLRYHFDHEAPDTDVIAATARLVKEDAS